MLRSRKSWWPLGHQAVQGVGKGLNVMIRCTWPRNNLDRIPRDAALFIDMPAEVMLAGSESTYRLRVGTGVSTVQLHLHLPGAFISVDERVQAKGGRLLP